MSVYEGPIVDAHQHFWEPALGRQPWLRPEARIPFRYGDYDAIKRRYLPDDYRRDAAGHDVVQTVYVETEWDPSDALGETAYATGLATQWGRPNAIVAQAWLDRADVADVLAAQAAQALVRSVRHKPGGPAGPREAGRTLMSDPAWRRGYALLSRHGLHFDLQTPWWCLHEAAELARDFPETTLILNHAGLPGDRTADSLAGWQSAMSALARCPNVVVKLSGLGVAGQRWTVAANERVVRTTVELFGAGRTMIGSNFPVDSLCASLDEVLGGFKAILASLPPDEQEQVFCRTARSVYCPAA